MTNGSTNLKARRTIRRCRLMAGGLIIGSLAGMLGGAALTNNLSLSETLARLKSPLALFSLVCFYLIYLPASLRIYYILLLQAPGAFTAGERQTYQAGKRKWEKYLLRSALLAGILVIIMVLVRLSR